MRPTVFAAALFSIATTAQALPPVPGLDFNAPEIAERLQNAENIGNLRALVNKRPLDCPAMTDTFNAVERAMLTVANQQGTLHENLKTPGNLILKLSDWKVFGDYTRSTRPRAIQTLTTLCHATLAPLPTGNPLLDQLRIAPQQAILPGQKKTSILQETYI